MVVKKARKKAGLTQGQLAERMGVTRQYICHLESEKANPAIGTLQQIADALGAELIVKIEIG